MLYYLLDHLPTILDLSALRTRRRLGSATVKQKKEALVMLYDSTKSLLQTILRSLESGDENRWDDQTESGKACLYEMHQMSGSLYKPYKPDRLNATSLAQSHLPEKLTRAIPHVKTMVIAIRLKDQTRALESGQAALDEMNGARFSVIPGGRIAPTAESCEAAVVREHEKPVRKRRLSVRDRQILLPSTT